MDRFTGGWARVERRHILAGSALAATGGIPGLDAARPAAAQATSISGVYDVTAADYGAFGNFWHDDTPAIRAAVDDAITAGGGVVWLPGGDYRITGHVMLTGSGDPGVLDAPVTIQGAGQATTIYIDNNFTFPMGGNDGAFVAEGRDEAKHPLGAAATAGTRTVTLPAAAYSALDVDQVVGLEEDNPPAPVFGLAGKPRELHRVVAKDDATSSIHLDAPLLYDYSASGKAWRMLLAQGPTVRDLAVTSTRPEDDGVTTLAIVFDTVSDARIDNVTVFNCSGGILLTDVVGGHVDGCTINRLPQWNNSGGYGVTAAAGTCSVTIDNLVGYGTRHLFTTLSDQRGSLFYSGPRNITVVGGVGNGGHNPAGFGPLAIWDTHDAGIGIDFIGCTATGVGGQAGFQVRAKDVRLIDCVSAHNAIRGVATVWSADNVVIQGGEYAHNGDAGITASGRSTRVIGAWVHHNDARGIDWSAPTAGGQVWVPESVHVVGCRIHDNGADGIRDNAAAAEKARQVVVTGNVIPRSDAQTVSVQTVGGPSAVVANNVMLGYGSGDDGTNGLASNVITQNNVVDP